MPKDVLYGMYGPTDIGDLFEDPEDFEKFKDFVIARGPDGYIKNLNVGSISSQKTTNGSNSDNIISFQISIPLNNAQSFFDHTTSSISFNTVRSFGGKIKYIRSTSNQQDVFSVNSQRPERDSYFGSLYGRLHNIIYTDNVYQSGLINGNDWQHAIYQNPYPGKYWSWVSLTFNGYTLNVGYRHNYNAYHNLMIRGMNLAGVMESSSSHDEIHYLVTCNYQAVNNGLWTGSDPHKAPSGRLVGVDNNSMCIYNLGNNLSGSLRTLARDRIGKISKTSRYSNAVNFLGYICV